MDEIFASLIKKNIFCIVSISPYKNFVENGVTWRISYINDKLSLSERFTVYKYFRSSKDLFHFSYSNLTFEWTSNKYLNLLYIPLIFKILSFHREKPTCLYCNTLWTWLYGLFFSFFMRVPYIFDNHNVEFDRFSSYSKIMGFLVYPFEYLLVRNSLFTVLSSQVDRDRIEKLYKTNNNLTISNEFLFPSIRLVDRTTILSSLNIDWNKKIILFFGSCDYEPNIEAVRFIDRIVAPFFYGKNYLFVIAGKCSQNLKISADNIILLGFVDNIDDLISAADIIIAPIFSGWWVKIKILHSIALWKKVVTTPEGVRGIDFNPQQVFISEKENFCYTVEANL